MDKKRSAKEIIELTDKYVASTYNRSKIAIVKGKKSSVWDADGKRYLDFTSGIAVTNLGHSNPILSKFIQKNIIRLTHVSNYFYNEGQGVMAELLVNHIGKGRVFFCNSGAEAVEGALKASRLYASNQSTKQTEFIAFEGSFHGRTFGALSVTGQKKYHKGFTPLLSGVKFAKYGDIKDVASKINAKTAAVIVEPIQCESGVRIPPANFLEKLSVLCKQKNVLLIMDEVQTGCSRTGKFLAYEHTKAKPSIVTMAKGIANGFPMGAVWLSADVAKKSLTAGSHGTTFGGGPLVAGVAAESFKMQTDKKLQEHVTSLGRYMLLKLNGLKESSKNIKAVRGLGLMIAVDITKPSMEVIDECANLGLLIAKSGDNTIRIHPSLVVKREEVDKGLNILGKVLLA